MWEIWEMFRMVRIVIKDSSTWTNAYLREKVATRLKKEYGKSPHFSEIVKEGLTGEIYSSNDFWMSDRGPVNTYALKYIFKLKIGGAAGFEKLQSRESQESLNKSKEILRKCVENGFVERNPENKNIIRLTKKGSRFGDPSLTGLLNEWLVEVEPIAIRTRIIWTALGGIIVGTITLLWKIFH